MDRRRGRAWAAFFLQVVSLMVIAPLQAEVFRWTDREGRVHFGDRPPVESKSESLELRINTYDAPHITTSPRAAGTQADVGSGEVVMYSASWCGVCKQARAYFRRAGIPFSEYDVEKSSKGRRDFQRLGGQGVPVILVGGGRMNGFTVAGFEALYRRR